MAMQETLAENTVIIKEKKENDMMYMVLSGTVALYINYRKDDEYLLGLCSKGTVFGEMGLLCHEPSMYTAVSLSEVKVASFTEAELEQFVITYPGQTLGIMRSTARMNKVLTLNLKMLMEDNKEEARLVKMLSEAMKDDNDVSTDTSSAATWHSTRKK